VHLDHAADVAEIDACLRRGYTSVVFDGAALPMEENVDLNRRVVERARLVRTWAEAELAGIPADDDDSRDDPSLRPTDPGLAATFVEATRVDALAVAVGNVHGIPRGSVRLDFECSPASRRRLRSRSSCTAPLDLRIAKRSEPFDSGSRSST
jgi:fructose/tagatose bisphosphate aldolase